MKKQRSEATICFQDWCAKVYDENADLINGLATIAGFIVLVSIVSKSLNN